MRVVTLQFESKPEAPSVSRSRLAQMRSVLEPRYDDVVLLVSELLTNSVRHSVSEGIDVTIKASEAKVRVEVTDEGPGFTPHEPRGDGWGLAIVEKVADRWGMKEGDKFTVWAEISKNPA